MAASGSSHFFIPITVQIKIGGQKPPILFHINRF
jgi:hypothetical protein